MARRRVEFVPSDEERLTGLLVSQPEIARDWIRPPIDAKTLLKHFRAEINRGRARTYVRLKALLLRAAEAGNVRAQIYLLERFFWDLHSPPRPKTPALPAALLGDNEGPVRIVEIPDNGRDESDAA